MRELTRLADQFIVDVNIGPARTPSSKKYVYAMKADLAGRVILGEVLVRAVSRFPPTRMASPSLRFAGERCSLLHGDPAGLLASHALRGAALVRHRLRECRHLTTRLAGVGWSSKETKRTELRAGL